ncbi:MAG: HlyC/CorC family transporter [Clostridiales bacterium]|nr:HlyC/CorC family transporter [Clostridiales bacterium]
MNDSIGLLLLIQVALIALNAVFASAEIALLSMNEAKLSKLSAQGDKRAGRLSRLISEPAKFLATIQVAITLSGFLGSAFAADNFSDRLVDWLVSVGVGIPRNALDTISVIVITLVLSYFTLIFGELVPKRIAQRKSEKLALGVSGIISGISIVFKPVVWFLTVSTNGVLRLMGIDPNEKDNEVSEEDIRLMVDTGSESGAIDHEEKEFIQNVFEFDDLTAGEIATHRKDVIALSTEDSMEEWAQTIHSTRHTLYPVYESMPDDVVGILNAKDYFRLEDKSRENVMKNAVSRAYFIPDSVKADVLFKNMKRSRRSLAVVVDEYGGMVGIVTINDLIEQLVGSLSGDVSTPADGKPFLRKMDDRSWEVFGNLELNDIERATGLAFENDEVETITGLVYDALGIIPKDGHQDITVTVDGVQINIMTIEAHQIVHCRIRKEGSQN